MLRLAVQAARFRGDKDGRIEGVFGMQTLPMVWDFGEINPFGGASNDARGNFENVPLVIEHLAIGQSANVQRGSADSLPWRDMSIDAVITDPPYYDNVPYADLSDFFYVWLKRSIGDLFPNDFAGEGTPKKEIVADATRHSGSKDKARREYERMMAQSFSEAHRVLKGDGQLAVVYTHKTTLGWTTLVNALREAKFMVTEAWPLDTEMKTRMRSMDSAALASSIFLVARKRAEPGKTGNFEEEVRPQLETLVREKVDALWEMGISGGDLVIACLGAGLRAFTRFTRVEFANGEEVPAERFLTEVEAVVLDTILQKLSKAVGGNGSRQRSLAGLDSATRFYVLWRYTYGWAELDAGEAIIFANGTHVELDGPLGLSTGARALVEKKKANIGCTILPTAATMTLSGCLIRTAASPARRLTYSPAALAALEKRPPLIPEFIADAQPNLDQLRLVAQALAGPALKGGEMENVSPTAEQSALGKLLANWSTVMEGKAATQDRRAGQQQLRFG